MNNIETICNSILDKANIEKDKMIQETKNIVEHKIKDAEKEILENNAIFEKNLEILCNQILEKAKNNVNLECNKLTLALKQEILNDIFSSITQNLCNLELEKYKTLINNLLVTYAKQNDCISLSKDSKLNEEIITSLNVFKERNLTFLPQRSDIKGGFILSNSKSDTIVSFENLVEELKEKYQVNIINELFS